MAKSRKISKEPRRGKPSLLTEEIIEKAVKLAEGASFQNAIAAKLNVNKLTWDSWMRRGRQQLVAWEKDEGPYTLQCKLVEKMGEANANAKIQCFDKIMENGDPRILLKFYQWRFGRPSKPESYLQEPEDIDESTDVKDLLAQKIMDLLD